MERKKSHAMLTILLIIIVLFSVIILPGCRSSGLSASGVPKLSELEDEVMLQYIQACKVTFPKYVHPEDAEDLSVIRTMLRELEEDPEHEEPFLSGMVYWIDVYEDLRKVVKIYYRIED